jgi:hypothetical protein
MCSNSKGAKSGLECLLKIAVRSWRLWGDGLGGLARGGEWWGGVRGARELRVGRMVGGSCLGIEGMEMKDERRQASKVIFS